MHSIQEAIARKPDFAEVYTNLGAVLMHDPSKLEEAIANYRKAIQLDPDNADAHFRVISSRYCRRATSPTGWELYEWRHGEPGHSR